MELPNGLLPLKDILEVGYNRSTGFVWLTQKNQAEHKFKAADRLVWYDKVVTAFVEKRKMRKVTGVKAKELLIWVSIEDIYVDEKDLGTVTFSNSLTGISRSFHTSAFQLEEVYK
ncbi:hypothetical protein K2173_006581 [Erythroxylum novogranatense]|uniref:DUF538 domain-containing protein n=1 Tax=Erythroxylum novogranatense TaxID=1862640 RepID=A0AAV8T6Q4_9ROSI|nr:hypothetical protein K2173_006581 [Erythroxylum novogranatense]